MKIDPKRLSHLRKEKGWPRPQLSGRSGITVRTIQRLENESQRCQKSQEHTVNSLAKALGVEPGVLTGELPLPKFDKAPDPKPVQVGAQVAPKVRLAYDLIKRRYGVSATEVINMAPLFFALLAEGSLAWRREKIEEVEEEKSRLEQIEGFWRGGTLGWIAERTSHDEGIKAENDSIKKADLFGEHLLSYDTYTEHFNTYNYFFYPSTDNPFASYLRKLKAKLDITDDDKVKVSEEKDGDLVFGSSPLKFPDYDICCDELDSIANGSTNAKRALTTGYARLSEIPEELMAEDSDEKRAEWLEDRLPDIFKEKEIEDLAEIQKKEIEDMLTESKKDPEDDSKKLIKADKLLRKQHDQREELFRSNRYAEETAHSASLDPEGDLKKRVEEADSQETDSDTEKGGDDQ